MKMKPGMELGLGPSHIVLDVDPAASQKKGTQQPPTFRLMYCGHAAGWIKMPLGTEEGLGSGHTVLEGDPAPPAPKKGHSSPRF